VITRIVVADDHQLFRQAIRSLLDGEADMEVVGEAENGRRALEIAAEQHPDVVLMDLRMPVLSGIEATRRLQAESPHTAVVCLSMHPEPRLVEAALQAGAKGYLLKDCDREELLRAIRVVAAGRVHLCTAVTGAVVEGYLARTEPSASSAFTLLSSREREVLQLIAEGYCTREIAKQLSVSIKTVASHREHLLHKLSARSVADLTRYAIREQLVSLDR
jgi:DNA-binding NarL/FixJ family response regulator